MHFRNHWRFAFAFVCSAIIVLSGCSPKEHALVVATVGTSTITLPDYENEYLKNSPSRDSAAAMTMPDRQRFLDLMINYRLKLAEAAAEHVDMRPEIIQEIRQNKGDFASSYVLEQELVAPALRKMYARRTESVRISQMIFLLNAKSTPADSANARLKVQAVLDSLKMGISFAVLARNNSGDPSAAETGGDLHFISGGMAFPEFEDCAYAMKVGEVKTLTSKFGIHLIKVTDRRPFKESRCSHIMIISKSTSPEDTLQAFTQISALKDSLAAGIPFANLAKAHSQDKFSAPAGGDLGWPRGRKYPLPFELAIDTLKPGQTSGIVHTRVGYHIILCTDVRGCGTFDELKSDLQNLYQKNLFPDDKNRFMEKLYHSAGLVYDSAAVKSFLAQCDSSKTTSDSSWAHAVTPSTGRKIILSAKNQSVTLDSVVAILNQHPSLPLRSKPFFEAIDKIREQFTWTAVADSFALLYPSFASTLNDYRDGVLLYQLEQDNVWNRVAPNDSILQSVYAKNAERFTLPARIQFTDFHIASDQAKQSIQQSLKTGKTIDQIYLEDSVRMALPSRFVLKFGHNSSAMTKSMRKSLDSIGVQTKNDDGIAVRITAYSDTGKAAAAEASLRTKVINDYLTKKLGIAASPVKGFTHGIPLPNPATMAVTHDSKNDIVEVSIDQRLVLFSKKAESLEMPLGEGSDERTHRADSLTVGGISAPFALGGLLEIVRLDKREPARQKTFAEAQVEVSGLYQESESKRLEDEWLQKLRMKYPVATNSDALRAAFGPRAK